MVTQSNRDSGTVDAPGLPTPADRQDEVVLLERITAGDAAGQRRFFDLHAPRVWRLLYRITDDYDDAHDLTQETFLRVFRKLDRYDPRGSLQGWLARVAVNLARDELRTRRRRAGRLNTVHNADESRSPSDPLLRERVRAAVHELSYDERAVLVMHDLEGYTHEEIGMALGIATGSSRARLSRARRRLRDRLRDIHTGNAL